MSGLPEGGVPTPSLENSLCFQHGASLSTPLLIPRSLVTSPGGNPNSSLGPCVAGLSGPPGQDNGIEIEAACVLLALMSFN